MVPTVPVSMADLRHHVRVVVVAARRRFGKQTRVLVRIETKRPRRHHPRLGEHVGVLNRDLVDERVALARETLDRPACSPT